jgi:LPS export ABC transporter protein LptC
MDRSYRFNVAILSLFILTYVTYVSACSFDYGVAGIGDSSYPDITMEDMEYTRVRKSRPVARLQAELAERYEKQRRMELKNYSFEQYNTSNAEVDALGSGGFATVELDTSSIHMSDGVEIIVDSEDIFMETERLDWDDGKKTLKGGENLPVKVEQSNGTKFTGLGFSADVRSRSWLVSSDANGVYVHDDDEEDENDSTGEAEVTEKNAANE